MPDALSEFHTKFRIDELAIYRSAFWCWSLRPHQPVLAAGIVSLVRPATAFSHVTCEEAADLAKIVRVVEGALAAAFAYDKINHLMLMMVDHHLHWHVLPRYAAPRSFGGITWQDTAWPGPPALASGDVSSELLHAVLARLRELAHGR